MDRSYLSCPRSCNGFGTRCYDCILFTNGDTVQLVVHVYEEMKEYHYTKYGVVGRVVGFNPYDPKKVFTPSINVCFDKHTIAVSPLFLNIINDSKNDISYYELGDLNVFMSP